MVTPELIAPQTVEEPLDALERHMASFLGAKVFSSLPVILDRYRAGARSIRYLAPTQNAASYTHHE